MTEADLKRALLRSLRAQGGVGYRNEDKYRVGAPDLYMHANDMPPFHLEAKMLRDRASLHCTEQQAATLLDLDRPPWAHAAIIGFSEKRDALYIGRPGDLLKDCRYVPRPSRFDSSDWRISELLGKFHYDVLRGVVVP